MCLNKTKLLIASSSPDEAITKCILDNYSFFNSKFDLNIRIVLIDEILTRFNINDELSDTASIIRWFKPNETIISNQTHYLLNRTLFIHKTLFSNFIHQDQEYAKREFEAYLGYSFNSFEGIGNQSVNGLCGTFYALPEQWEKMRSCNLLHIPQYYWGPKKYCHLKHNIVHSDIYDLFNWSTKEQLSNAPHLFCFKKPPGLPLFILSLGDKILVSYKTKLTSKLNNQLIEIIHHIKSCFDYFIFEVLLFIEDETIYFGCVNLEIIQSIKHPSFSSFICQHLLPEYLKCLN